jgi:hypothetical protein
MEKLSVTSNRAIDEILTTQEEFKQLLIIRRLSIILKIGKEHHLVRNAVINAVCNQIRYSCEKIELNKRLGLEFQEISPYLQALLSELTRNELDKIIKRLTDSYLKQRESLDGGDDEIEVNGHRYQIWIDSERPETSIETVILEWLGNKKYPIAQQIAMQTRIEFASVLEQAEAKRIQEIQEQRGYSTEQNPLIAPTPVEIQSFPIIGKIATFWRAQPYQSVISNLLPEAVKQSKSREDVLNFELSRWKDNTNTNKDIFPHLKLGLTSHRLYFGLSLVKYRPLWLTLVALGMLGISFYTLTQLMRIILSFIAPVDNPQAQEEPEKGIFVLPDANVRAVDATNFNQGKLTVSITNGTPDDRLWIHNQSKNRGEIGVDGSNVTYGGENIGSFKGGKETKPLEVSFDEKSTPEAAQTLLRNIKYTNIAKQPVVGLRKVQFQIKDGQENGTSKPFIKNINVIAENQAPKITVPESQTVQESASLSISGIKISYPDGKNITLSLTVNHGILTVKPDVANDLTVQSISNNKSKNVTIKGTISQIKTILSNPNTITYQGEKDFSGDDILVITVKDDDKAIPDVQAKSLKWPPNTSEPTANSQNINIAVTPLKARPVITVPEGKTVKENTKLPISGISIKDPSSPKLTVTLSVNNGIISVKDKVPQGLTAKEISNNTNKTVTLTGTVAQINNTLVDSKAITYQGNKDFNGEESLVVTAENYAKKTSSKKISINVTHIHRPPEITESN